jgi:hypothetical protein
MTLSDISTELLIKLRERFLSGRTRFLAFAGGQDDPKAAEWMKETLIVVVENELHRRLN